MSDASQSEPESSAETPSPQNQWETLETGIKINPDQFEIVDPPKPPEEPFVMDRTGDVG